MGSESNNIPVLGPKKLKIGIYHLDSIIKKLCVKHFQILILDRFGGSFCKKKPKIGQKMGFWAKTQPQNKNFKIFYTKFLDILVTSVHSKFQVDSSRNDDDIKIWVPKS